MPVIPQITNPFQGKGYQSALGNPNRQSGEQFSVTETAKPPKVGETDERQAGGKQDSGLLPNRTDLPQLMVRTAKDPTMAVETLKQLISSELLATASANGYTELHGELEGLSKSIYLSMGDLVNEILNQESQTTMFSGGKLFDLLRNLANTAVTTQNEDMANSIASFLKAVNFTFNRGEILNALSANLKFLSTYFSPSPPLSEKLGELARAWGSATASENFEGLKSETVKLLYNVSESLLNNEKTQILIPLIIHNLSRYNTNDYMLKEAFSGMMVYIPQSQKGSYISAFEDFIRAVLGKAERDESPNGKPQARENHDGDRQDQRVGEQPQRQSESNTKSTKQDAVTGEKAERNESAERESEQGRAFPTLYSKKLADGGHFPPAGMTRDSLADGLRGFLMSRFSGMQAVSITLGNLIEGSGSGAFAAALQSDLVQIDSIAALVEYLNHVLAALPDSPEQQTLFEMLSEIISGMAENSELPPESPNKPQSLLSPDTQEAQIKPDLPTSQNKPDTPAPQQGENADNQADKSESPSKSSIHELTAFIEKNINHNALKTLDSYNASNLLQSLINAPGVHTPLAHFVIPLQIGDARAFGELWVDNDDKSAGAVQGGKNYHLFLTFEIERFGRFETDMYAHDSEVSLALLYPDGFAEEIDALKEKVTAIIAGTPYTMKEFHTAVLREPHDLAQIFPKINEKRTGLDITI